MTRGHVRVATENDPIEERAMTPEGAVTHERETEKRGVYEAHVYRHD